MKNKLLISIIVFCLVPLFGLFAQKKDTTMAILEDKQQYQNALQTIYANKSMYSTTTVLYKNKLYKLSEIDLRDKLAKNKLTLTIQKDPDTINRLVAEEGIATLIVLKDLEQGVKKT